MEPRREAGRHRRGLSYRACSRPTPYLRLTMKRNFGLDLLRALAILLVLISHSRFCLVDVLPEAKYFQLGGFWGVELFFVLSGLLIGNIIIKEAVDEQNFSLVRFWKRRWYRTIPNYFLFLALNILYLLTVSYSPAPIWKYFFFMQNFAWEHPQFFPESWSLAVEEVFYLMFPVLVILLVKLKCKAKGALLFGGLFILLSSTALRCVHVYVHNPNWYRGVRTVVIYRLDAVMYGILLALYLRHSRTIGKRLKYAMCAVSALLLLASAVVFFSANRDEDFFSRTLLFSMTSLGFALMMPAVMDLPPPKRGFVEACWRKMALWSYSLYLSNLLVYNLVRTFWLEGVGRTAVTAVLACCVFVGASIVISAVVYRYYELPILESRDRTGRRYTGWWSLKRA